MNNKTYPTTEKEWAKYLTIKNYYTMNEIGYKKNLIEDSNCNFDKIVEIVQDYRNKHRNTIFEFNEKKFYIVETQKLKNNIEDIKNFWKTTEYLVKDKFTFELLKETLICEGFYSSTIEGAHSTVKRARTLAKGYEQPKDKDELMIYNNFTALMELRNKDDMIDNDLIQNIHNITTKGTLEKVEDEGIYRTVPNEILGSNQKVIFIPPQNISIMNKMIDELLEFLQEDELKKPIDNIYKAISFHFLFSYIHPFIDGNGRTVRILFTYLLKHYGYDMFYYISLSEIIYRKKAKDYYKSFIDVERSDLNDKNSYDMTYFFYYMSDVMIKGLSILKTRINTHMREDVIKHIVDDKKIDLTPRQKKIIKILSNKDSSFMLTAQDMADRFKLSDRTIQKDLKLLIDFNLIVRIKAPNQRKYYFRLNIDL